MYGRNYAKEQRKRGGTLLMAGAAANIVPAVYIARIGEIIGRTVK
jgi:hypothetical protein